MTTIDVINEGLQNISLREGKGGIITKDRQVWKEFAHSMNYLMWIFLFKVASVLKETWTSVEKSMKSKAWRQ